MTPTEKLVEELKTFDSEVILTSTRADLISRTIQTLTQLQAELKEKEKELALEQSRHETTKIAGIEPLTHERNELRNRLTTAQEDTKRLDWLETHEYGLGFPTKKDPTWYLFGNAQDDSEDYQGPTLRTAITQAMNREKKP